MTVQTKTSRAKSLRRRIGLVAVPLVLASLGACATPFNANVSRFASDLPAPQGKTFAVVAEDPKLAGGLEFSQYARFVEAQMTRLGYAQTNPENADLLVRFDYGVDKGRDRVRSTGFGRGYGYDPFWGPWHSPWGYGRGGFGYGSYWGSSWGGWGRPYSGRPWGYGWYDPWFDDAYESYTVYTSDIDMKIDRRADGKRLFEGKAEAASTSNRLQYLVPNLVEAMFTDFPGHNGETVRISIAPEKKTIRKAN